MLRSSVKNFNMKNNYYLSGGQFLVCCNDKFYHASFAVGSVRQISGYPTARLPHSITMPHSNVYLECPDNFWRTFSSVCKK